MLLPGLFIMAASQPFAFSFLELMLRHCKKDKSGNSCAQLELQPLSELLGATAPEHKAENCKRVHVVKKTATVCCEAREYTFRQLASMVQLSGSGVLLGYGLHCAC